MTIEAAAVRLPQLSKPSKERPCSPGSLCVESCRQLVTPLWFPRPDSYDLEWVEASAEALPFPDDSMDSYTISFGIRNVTDRDVALREATR